MAHQSQLEQRKYRNWVKAGLGLKYVKEGIEAFCQSIAQHIHTNILQNISQRNGGLTACGNCTLRTLKPNHVKIGDRRCPLGQPHCNCLCTNGKIACPSNVCDAIYDEIIKLHASTPPAPYWRNTDVRFWCTNPWEIAKCFINAPGYEKKKNASETDTTGLLHVIINNFEFLYHTQCQISGQDIFSQVRQDRNEILHRHSMELEDAEAISYIDDMIALLQDGKELVSRRESKEAVQKLIQLKQEDFIITTKSETEVVKDVLSAILLKEQELKETIQDAHFQIDMKRAEFRSEVEERLKELDDRLSARTDVLVDSEASGGEVSTIGDGTSNNETGTSDTRIGIDNRSINTANIRVSSESRSCVLFNNSPLHGCNIQITMVHQNQ